MAFTHQSRPNTCIAACVAMVLSHHGQPTTEAALVARWGDPGRWGYSTNDLGRALRSLGGYVDLTERAGWALITAHLNAGRWLVATMFPGHMTVFAREYAPALVSPHGPMVTQVEGRAALLSGGTHQRPLHAVVLTERTPTGVKLLDPYHLGTHQPLDMTDEQLIQAATGSFWRA